MARRMTNLYSRLIGMTIQLIIFCDALLRNQYRYITLDIFSCKMFILSNMILIIIGISNKIKNELT